ncbi:hypothetical protein BDQ17DRAFT_1363055 [Cyathus striatus]|nr:hypothetical protein BDQ17DRAFT_1363055 [Cyathus striatus]
MFHQDNVSYNVFNGMTYDGTLLDPVTGVHNSLHMMMLAHVIEGNPKAVRWILLHMEARGIAFSILQTKWETYSNFNKTYPGFGGFLPWFAHQGAAPLAPTWDWVNRVPGLDNGENIWAIYAVIEALDSLKRVEYQQLAQSWSSYLNYLKKTAQTIFYRGSGRICAVTNGLDSGGNPYLNDPYEGQQFMWFIYLFTGLNETEKQAIWDFKRLQLVAIDWNSQAITVLRYRKNWGWMQMPYTDVPLLSELYSNMERARTCNSRAKQIPGMFASVNNSTDVNGQITGCKYISNAGIPSIANQTIQELDVITPYSTMNTTLVNKTVGLAWWHSMVSAKRMQNLYGSSESTRVDGKATSAFASWDSKITTVNGLLGGVTALVKRHMQRDGIYSEFISVIDREYGLIFREKIHDDGQDDYCLPSSSVPDTGLSDFTSCQ